MKKGMTIIEIMVGMTIFLVVVTLAVGAFVSVSRMRALTNTMKESQLKMRIANEMLSRHLKEANAVEVINDKTLIVKYIDNYDFVAEFKILADGKLNYCERTNTTSCTKEVNLFSGGQMKLDSESRFSKIGTIPPAVEYKLIGITDVVGNIYYSDKFTISNKVILEGLK